MIPTRLAAPVVLLALAGCADSGTQVLPPYELANGRVLQDVVTVAADRSAGAPVITALTTYDVHAGGEARVVSHASASAPGTGQLIAAGLGQVGTGVTAAVIADAILDDDDDDGGGTMVSSVYNTSGNTADGGDAGDIDAVTVVCPGDPRCSVSN
jgi:hypothetical protein